MAKTASVFSRVEPEIKDEAERVLSQLGIPMSNAIDMFLRQVAFQKKMPFELSLPKEEDLFFDRLTREELNQEIQKGIDDLNQGRIKTSKEVRKKMVEKLGMER